MKNAILSQALSVSMENLEDNADLIEEHQVTAGDLTPEVYVEERLEIENDVEVLEEAAAQIENNETVSHEQLDHVAQLANAVMGRYGISFEGTGLESTEQPAARATQLATQIRQVNASLESHMNVAMESYSIRDLWDSLSMLNREIPNMGDKIAVLKNYTGNTKIRVGGLYKIFMVNGVIASNIPAEATKTAALCETMLSLGEEAVNTAKKAADIAFKADWADEDAAEKAIKQITAMRNPGKEMYDKLDEKWTLSNRRLNVKKFDIKGADAYREWGTGYSLNVSWVKASVGEIAASLFGTAGAIIYLVATGGSKREVKMTEMVSALEKIKSVATKSASIRSNAPRKWSEHKALVKKLKADVRGGPKAKVAIRMIAEMDRAGWQALNGAFTVLTTIIRQLNDAADVITHAAKNR